MTTSSETQIIERIKARSYGRFKRKDPRCITALLGGAWVAKSTLPEKERHIIPKRPATTHRLAHVMNARRRYRLAKGVNT